MNSGRESAPDRKNLTQTSIVLYFLIGGALLVSPLIVVFNWNPLVCSLDSLGQQKCSMPQIYSRAVSFLPFVMVIGGVLIGYNMKRISDSLRIRESEESEEEEQN